MPGPITAKLSAYDNLHIRGHEEIYFERSQKRFDQINNLNAQIGPIYVIHPDSNSLNELIEKGALVIGHDPKGMDNFKELIDIEMAETAKDAIKETDCIILMTEWKEYTELNYETIKREMNGNVVIDGRRGFNQKRMEETGFDYKAIGLG